MFAPGLDLNRDHELNRAGHRCGALTHRDSVGLVDLTTSPQNYAVTIEYEGQSYEVRFNGETLARIKKRLIDLGVAPESFAWPSKGNLGMGATPYPGLEPF